MFIVLINYKKPLEIVDQYLASHRLFLDEGYEKNFLVASGPRNPRTGGILVSQLNDRVLLESFIKRDPYYVNDVAEYEIIDFSPVKYHKDFQKFLA